MLNPAGEFASTFARHRARRKSHMSYLSDWETVIHRYGAVTQTTGTFATVNRSDTKLPDPSTSTAVKRHTQINLLQHTERYINYRTSRPAEQWSNAQHLLHASHNINTPNSHPPPVVVLVVSNKSQARAVSNAQTGCPSLSPPSFVGREGGTCNTAHCILPPSTAFERSLQGVCALAPVAGRLTSVTYHGQTVQSTSLIEKSRRKKNKQTGKVFRNRISFEVSHLHVTLSLLH